MGNHYSANIIFIICTHLWAEMKGQQWRKLRQIPWRVSDFHQDPAESIKKLAIDCLLIVERGEREKKSLQQFPILKNAYPFMHVIKAI